MTDLSMLKVCFLAGTLGQGGAERQLYYLLKTLREQGADPRLLSLTRGEFWEERIRELGIPVTWVGSSPSRLARLRRIIAEVRRTRPAIVQSQHSFTNLYAALAARAAGALEIGAIRNDAIREINDLGRIMGFLSRRLPRIMAANSRLGIRNLTAAGVDPSRLLLLRNVVDTDYFIPGERREAEPVRILAVGRMAPQKRFDRFLRIMARVARQTSYPIEAVLAGDGPLRRGLEAQAAEMGLLKGAVEFVGNVTDTRALYHRADLLVMTSDWEGTPNVALEAMSCGLPVIATSVGDLPEIVEQGATGALVAPEEEDLFAVKLLELIANRAALRGMGSRARDFVVANYSLLQLPSILRQFYDQCTGAHRR